MGLFSSSKTELRAAFQGYCEHHCHILPGVDDGFRSMEQSLSVLAKYQELGVKEVWLTPHVMEDVPNTPESLKERFEELKAEMDKAGITLKVQLASEHMMDNLFSERLSAGQVLPMEGKQLLVETSYFNPPMDLHGVLRKVMSKGYFPVLAHPERYLYMDMKDYKALKEMGVRFQMNLTSLAGLYGPQAKAKAEKLLSLGYYEMMGTDLHRESTLEDLMNIKIKSSIFQKLPL